MIKRTKGENIFNVFNIFVMTILMLVCLYPFLYVVFASFSDPNALMGHSGLLLAPLGFDVSSYVAVLKYDMVWTGYMNTLIIIVVGVSFNVVMTTLGAFALSRRYLMWKKQIMLFIVFTMFFSGGLIPFYFTIKDLGMYDSLWSLILPGAISTFNLIILRTAFESIPESLEESAELDGAGEITVLTKIILPLSLPTIAVIVLYYTVGHWNSWFNASLFIPTRAKQPLQLILREILIGNDTGGAGGGDVADQQALAQTIKYAVVIVSTLPILIAYPYLQKYFVKGTMVGAVKG